MQLRIQSPLPPETEIIVTRTIGAVIEVHRALGPGFREGAYEDALMVELAVQGLKAARQRPVVLQYRGVSLRPQVIDFVVEEHVVLELKSVERLLAVHKAQVIAYLRATKLRIGLLINFNAPVVEVRRVIL